MKPDEWLAAGEGRGEAIDWFQRFFQAMPALLPEHQQPIVCDMLPGDVIFVPGGWFHTVLNMEDTVAVTQNFVSSSNFPAVWQEFQATRAKLSRGWLRGLQTVRPDLVEVAESKGTKVKAGKGGQGPGAMSRGKASRDLQKRIDENHAMAKLRRIRWAFTMMREYDGKADDGSVGDEEAGEEAGEQEGES